MLRFILFTLSLLYIANASASTAPSSSIPQYPFPLLPSYLEIQDKVYKWFAPINKIVMYHVNTFITLNGISNNDEELDVLRW